MFEQNLLDARRGDAPFATSNSLTNSTYGVTKTAFHTQGCACAGCHAHGGEGKDFQPGGAGTASEDTIPGDTSTTETLSPGGGYVTSTIDTGNDTDWFAIELVAGETYTFSTYIPPGSGVDTTLTLRDAAGNQIIFNDDANTNAALYFSEITYTATTTGTFYLDVGSWSTTTGQYFLSSSRPTNDDVGGDVAGSVAISLGETVNSDLSQNGDRDWYAITLTAGQAYEILTQNTGGSNDADTTLTLRDAQGNVIAWNDDSSGTYSRLRFSVETSGTYYIDVGGWADSSSGDYRVVAAEAAPLEEYTNEQIADQLLSGYWGGEGNERRFDVSQGDTITVNITGLTAAGQFLAREALNLWGDVIGISFSEVSSGGQIIFDDEEEGAFASSFFSNGFITQSEVNVSTDWLANSGTTLDSYSFQTYLHEIGHALGLGHGGNYNSSASYEQDALYLNDSWATTVMSYFSQRENSFFNDQGFSGVFTLTPMSADVVAIQESYGFANTTRTGNTTYGVGNNTGRAVYGVGPAVQNNAGNLLAFTIVDHGGTDTLNYSVYSANQLINLNEETFSNVGGSVGNMSIARGTVIENAVGGSGNDQLIGNSRRNTLTGGQGNDTIDGGINVDTAVVSGNRSQYTITQTSVGVFRVSGADGTDTLTNIEYLKFADQTIRLLRGEGVSVDFSNAGSYQSAMNNIKDFGGNDLGGDGSWLWIGEADINGDGDMDQILVNNAIGRFATVGTADDGLVYFDDHSWAGETRVAGIYIDPLVTSGEVEAGGPFDSQRRFRNDLEIENISGILGADDYNNDGIQEVYFALADGTAYLRALMHDDGNIRYANYQNEQQVREYLESNGYGEETFGEWFESSDSSSQAGQAVFTDKTGEFATAEPSSPDTASSQMMSPKSLGADMMGDISLAANFILTEEKQVEFFG